MISKYIFLPALLLVACGGDGGGNGGVESGRHVPEIVDLAITPDTATLWEGDGDVVVTAQVRFRDAGRDIKTLWIRMPDGTTVEFDEPTATETGIITEAIVVSTGKTGVFSFDFGLLDEAGYGSINHSAKFEVVLGPPNPDWTNRLSALSHTLFDVVWNGSVFIAVGGGGAIFTSADGISWVERDSGTDASLNAVAADGPYVVTVGFEGAGSERGIILQSTDDGASWAVRSRPAEAVLEAVAINSSQVVVGGYRFGSSTAVTMLSEDRGDTWQAVDSWPEANPGMNDLVYRDGMFFASTNAMFREGSWVTVSQDGKLWSEIAVSDEHAVFHTISQDEDQFILAGSWGEVFTSPDGFNWTRLQTPVRDVFYTSAAWNDSRLMLAGGFMCIEIQLLCDTLGYVPVGLSSTDGGVTWEAFNIDGAYESWGLAWGNGRFVSVGGKPRLDGSGAVYTME